MCQLLISGKKWNAQNRLKTSPKPKICFCFYHSRKKKYSFFLYCARECKVKDIQIIINPRFYFTDTRKQLWICCNIYESVVSITSPLKTTTDPLKEIKTVKTDPKKVPSQISFCLFLKVQLPNFLCFFFHFTIPLNIPSKSFDHFESIDIRCL